MTISADIPEFDSEFSRLFDIRQADGQPVRLEANSQERMALARRFDIERIDSLLAEVRLTENGGIVEVRGTMTADYVQACAVSAEDLDVHTQEPIAFRFVPDNARHTPDEEVELEADELDDIPYSGTRFDIGEAVAQSLALAIDPFLTGPDADAARAAAGIGTPEDQSPFAALKGLATKS